MAISLVAQVGSPLASPSPRFTQNPNSMSREDLFIEESRLSRLKENLLGTIDSLEVSGSPSSKELAEDLWIYYRTQDRRYLQVRKAILSGGRTR